MSDREHVAFMAIIDRLRAEAEARGDVAFAEALAACLLHVSGGDLNCPMGQLILEDSLRAGTLPGAALSALPPSRPAVPRAPSRRLTRQALVEKLLAFLRQEATRRGDTRYLEAVSACHLTLTTESGMEDCPLRRLLHAREDSQEGAEPCR